MGGVQLVIEARTRSRCRRDVDPARGTRRLGKGGATRTPAGGSRQVG